GSRNSPDEDRKPAEYKDKDPVQEMETARGSIAALATTKGSTRRDRSPEMPTQAKGMKGVDGTGQGRKDSLEKRTLAASQTEEAPESLHYCNGPGCLGLTTALTGQKGTMFSPRY